MQYHLIFSALSSVRLVSTPLHLSSTSATTSLHHLIYNNSFLISYFMYSSRLLEPDILLVSLASPSNSSILHRLFCLPDSHSPGERSHKV